MTARKSAKPNSRDLLLRAAEELMREDGYAAVTSRRVAAKAGLKPQLVHYYFETMDDLFLALYDEVAKGVIARQDAVLTAEKPLREMMKIAFDSRGSLLNGEFTALANHRKAIRAKLTECGDRFRQSQIDAMEKILAKNGISGFPWTPGFAAVLLNMLARGLAVEKSIGMSAGHADAMQSIEHFIEKLEP